MELCDTPNYKAFLLRNTLVVENKQTKKQVALIGDEAIDWAEHIRTAIDNTESNALCSAIYTVGR